MSEDDIPPYAELADWIRDRGDVELVDFTRDGYRTMFTRVDDPAARERLEAEAEAYEMRATAGPEGERVVLEAPDGASEKVRWEVTG